MSHDLTVHRLGQAIELVDPHQSVTGYSQDDGTTLVFRDSATGLLSTRRKGEAAVPLGGLGAAQANRVVVTNGAGNFATDAELVYDATNNRMALGASTWIGAEKLRVVGDVRIEGNLNVIGTQATFNTTVVDAADRVIHMNHSEGANDPAPIAICGFSVHRGAIAGVARHHAGLFWNNDDGVADPSLGTGYFVFAGNSLGDDSNLIDNLDVMMRQLRVSELAGGMGIKFEVDGAADIGSALNYRPRRVYAQTEVVVGNTVTIDSSSVYGSAGLSLGPTAAQRHTVPAVDADTFAVLAASQTLSNKTLANPSVTGVLKIADGTAAAPAYTFTAETNMGMYRDGTTDLAFAVNGKEAFAYSTAAFIVSDAYQGGSARKIYISPQDGANRPYLFSANEAGSRNILYCIVQDLRFITTSDSLGATPDVVIGNFGISLGTTHLSSTVSNRLDLASGDSFQIVSGQFGIGRAPTAAVDVFANTDAIHLIQAENAGTGTSVRAQLYAVTADMNIAMAATRSNYGSPSYGLSANMATLLVGGSSAPGLGFGCGVGGTMQWAPGGALAMTLGTTGILLNGYGTDAPATDEVLGFRRNTNAGIATYLNNLSTGNAALSRVMAVINSGSGPSIQMMTHAAAHATLGGITRLAGFGTGLTELQLHTTGAVPITFLANGTEWMRLNAAGELGLGKTAASNILIDVLRSVNAQTAINLANLDAGTGVATYIQIQSNTGSNAVNASLQAFGGNYASPLTGLAAGDVCLVKSGAHTGGTLALYANGFPVRVVCGTGPAEICRWDTGLMTVTGDIRVSDSLQVGGTATEFVPTGGYIGVYDTNGFGVELEGDSSLGYLQFVDRAAGGGLTDYAPGLIYGRSLSLYTGNGAAGSNLVAAFPDNSYSLRLFQTGFTVLATPAYTVAWTNPAAARTYTIIDVGEAANFLMSAGDQTIAEGTDFTLGTTTGTKMGTAANQKFALYGGTPVVQGAALTVQLTTITHTDPGADDFAIQALTQTTPFGFVTADEGHTVLKVIANLQTRLAELEARLEPTTGVALIAAN